MKLMTVVAALATTAAFAAQAQAQRPNQVPPDPEQAVAEGFDTGRAIFWRQPNFQPLRNPEWMSLRSVRRARDISDDTPVLVFEAGGETLVLPTNYMSYHHVAQGERAGEPWMVTF